MYLLAIESSCDDTAVAVIKDGIPISNMVSSQISHSAFGGVVPEMASREHQKNIVSVSQMALKDAGVELQQMDAIGVTLGPGLPGSLMVGASFAKGIALGLGKPLIGVNHMEAHILSLLIPQNAPKFPFLCLVVSGGHTLLVVVRDWNKMEILGKSLDDAVGEAFDKCAKMLGLGYPGGRAIDELAKNGNPKAFPFPSGKVPDFDFSYSGFKTSVLYFIRDRGAEFVQANLEDICASIQHCLLKPLVEKSTSAMKLLGLKQMGIAGGVAANSGLRNTLLIQFEKEGWELFIPEIQYCTDNAAMIGRAAWYKWLKGDFVSLSAQTNPRLSIGDVVG